MWLLLLSVAVVAEWELPEEPVVMHAAALDRELDGDIDGALALLRAALALAPGDPMIAFDLARIAVEEESERFDEDVRVFMTLATDDDDARMLRAYVLARQGERQAAREQLNAVLATSPALGEATRLRDFVVQGSGAAPAQPLTASLRAGFELDNNITVVPDAPSRDAGVRIATQGNVTLVPVRAPTEVTVSLALKYAPHLNNRAVLSEFDVASAVAVVRLRRELGPLLLTGQLSANEIAIDSMGQQFMRDLFGDVELRYRSDRFHLGLFGRGGYRDFAAFNPEADSDDRDGARASFGVLADWMRGELTFGARASLEVAETEGRWQRERGSEVSCFVRWRSYPWQAYGGLNWALRNFPTTGGHTSRLDNRFTASASGSRMLDETFGLFGTLVWIENLSSQGYDYDRVLVQVGGLAQW